VAHNERTTHHTFWRAWNRISTLVERFIWVLVAVH